MPRFIRVILALLVLTAVGRQLFLHLAASYSALNFFSYFTNLSNLFAALVLLLGASGVVPQGGLVRDVLRFLSVVNMTVVGVVFSILLRNVDLGALLPWVNFIVHYLMPIAIVIDWLLERPASAMNVKHLALALVFPCIYLVYVLLRGARIHWYPYPFLNPENVGGYAGVAAYSAGIALTFLLTGWVLLGIANRNRFSPS